MVIKGNGAVNTMEAEKINTKEKERTKVTYHKSVFSSVLTGITWGAAILALAVLVFPWKRRDREYIREVRASAEYQRRGADTGAVCLDL